MPPPDPDPFAEILTGRHRLRCVREGDAAATAAMMTPAVSRWLAYWPDPFTPVMAAERIALMRGLARRGDALPLAIVDAASDTLLGWAMVVRDARDRRRASLGYWLGEAHHGHGHMREAVPAAVQAAFARLDVDVMEAAAQPENAGSLAILAACGFRPLGERTMFAPARQREEVVRVYELTRGETR